MDLTWLLYLQLPVRFGVKLRYSIRAVSYRWSCYRLERERFWVVADSTADLKGRYRNSRNDEWWWVRKWHRVRESIPSFGASNGERLALRCSSPWPRYNELGLRSWAKEPMTTCLFNMAAQIPHVRGPGPQYIAKPTQRPGRIICAAGDSSGGCQAGSALYIA